MIAPLVSATWVKENLNDPDLVILEAGKSSSQAGLNIDHDNFRIPSARFFDLENAFSKKESYLPCMLPDPGTFQLECRKLGLNRSSKIVVYDKPGIYFSPRVWWMFKSMGHERVAVLDGGLPAWLEEGNDTEVFQKKRFEAGNFEACYQVEKVADIEFLKNNLKTQSAVVIDARSEERFNGMAPEPRKGLRSGHIPGSVNIPFQRVLKEGKYNSEGELVRLFEDIEEKPLVFSCGSGITACIVLLAAELAGKKTNSVYDGSWTEWAQSLDLPVEKVSNEPESPSA